MVVNMSLIFLPRGMIQLGIQHKALYISYFHFRFFILSQNNSLSKMFGKIVTFRQPRISSVSSHNDEKKEVSQLKQDSMMKYQMPLLESNKKRTFISFSSDQVKP